MNKANDKKLCKKYPKIFAKRGADMRTTCMCWGFECGDGWFWLIDQLCSALQSRIDNTCPAPPQVVAEQVKEKWGGLRLYFSGGDSTACGMIDFAERLSYSFCEVCGTTNNVGRTTKGYITTLCGACAKEHDRVDWMSLVKIVASHKRRKAREEKAKAALKAKPHPFPKRKN